MLTDPIVKGIKKIASTALQVIQLVARSWGGHKWQVAVYRHEPMALCGHCHWTSYHTYHHPNKLPTVHSK